jgi:hypothetical protein
MNQARAEQKGGFDESRPYNLCCCSWQEGAEADQYFIS